MAVKVAINGFGRIGRVKIDETIKLTCSPIGDWSADIAAFLWPYGSTAIGAGSGKDGRITKGDVLEFLARPVATQAATPAARPPRELEAGEERVKMTRLRRTIAARLKEAQNSAAMLTTFNEVDMSAAMALRAEYRDTFEKKHNGVRLGFMGFFVKACVAALKEFPAVNAEIAGEDIVYKNFVHMGIAVGGANGLVVPVIRDAHTMSFAEIEKAIAEKGRRARDGKRHSGRALRRAAQGRPFRAF
jgi:2-oxoglutarate dehydrogenase E2 component (dihydrolipoamide succinyltransferase)